MKIAAKNSRQIKKISLISGVLLIVLLLISLAVNVLNANRLMHQMDEITEHPFQIIVAAGTASTSIAKMRVQTERLLYDNMPSTVASVRNDLNEIYSSIHLDISMIREKYLGDLNEISQLEKNFIALKEAHVELLSYAEADVRSEKEIIEYSERVVFPLYDKIEHQFKSLSNIANKDFYALYDETRNIRVVTIILSVTVVVAVFGALAIYQTLLRKQNREITNKNNLFDLLSKTIDHVFFVHNPSNSKENYVSENAERLIGFPAEILSLNPAPFYSCIDSESREILRKIFTDRKLDFWEGTFRYQFPDSSKILTIAFQTYRVKTTGGQSQYITVFTDETEQIRAKKELQSALEHEERANLAKSEFLSRMSHEIRTPMNGIIGMTIIALQNSSNEQKVIDCLKKISMSSKHLLLLINDILDMSKIESGKIEIKEEKFDFKVFIESLSTVFYGQAKEKEINFETILIGDIPETLNGDSLRLNQILNNLLSNALKFTPKNGSVTLRISQTKAVESIQWLRFEVKDSGCGIEKEKFGKIFNAFEQENSDVSHKYGGTGLGLSISKRFAELMGGKIGVDSKIGYGSTFTVDIPFGREKEQSRSNVNFDNLRALVVDDDIETCEHATYLLNKIGVKAVWVDNGYKAVAQIERARDQSEDYDVCLVDWKMPFIDGLETTRRIRKCADNSNLAVILITAYDASEIQDKALEAGANGILNKPIFESSLIQAFESIKHENLAFDTSKGDLTSYNFSNKRILIVEDNELNLEIAVESLHSTNVIIETAGNGKDAVEKFSESIVGYYDLILMDVQMPQMDGYEATRQIRQLTRPDAANIPIVAMTANAFSEDVEKSIQSGMNDHISKPIDLNEVFMKLKTLLHMDIDEQ